MSLLKRSLVLLGGESQIDEGLCSTSFISSWSVFTLCVDLQVSIGSYLERLSSRSCRTILSYSEGSSLLNLDVKFALAMTLVRRQMKDLIRAIRVLRTCLICCSLVNRSTLHTHCLTNDCGYTMDMNNFKWSLLPIYKINLH